MPYALAAVCTFALLGLLVGKDQSDHALRARLYRAQERWAEQMDRDADRHQAPDDRLVA